MVFGKSLNRRAFVTGLLTSGAAVASFPARAEDPISRAIQGAAIEWSDGFDAAASTAPDVRTFTPILSPEIIQSLEMAIAQYSDIVARGGWPMVPADKKMKIGGRGPSVTALPQRLMISGDLDPMLPSSDAFDSYVDAAVKRFQARHGIPADGVVGDSTFAALNVPAAVRLNQLSTNLTRLKMQMAKVPPGGRFVMVNIPAASVEAVEADRVVSRHTAVAGKVDRPSPIVNSKITEINFHPFWTVPASIIRKDLIPMMQKKPSYLTDYRIRVYDQKGNELQPQQINWNSDEATRYLFRQDPFDGNSLGTVKINFPSPDGVYMHDTPNKGLFNNEFRFDSSGCVRIQNIRDLIVWILRDTPGQTPEAIDAEFRDGQRRDVRVTNPVPVFWTYFTAWAVSDGVVHFRNDVYGLDGLEQYTAQATPL
ncbi:MAG TPA: L,D-transpeptidase family protein [Bauldia sp.]|nr:L,D-transpeptidase family protein [Bauldia sp.]